MREHIEEELKKHHSIPHGKGDKNYIRKLPGNIPDDVRKLIEEQIKKARKGESIFIGMGTKKTKSPTSTRANQKKVKAKNTLRATAP